MAITANRKAQVIQEAALKKGDNGSPEVQISLLTEHITHLTEHLKLHRKDFSSRRGLLMKVSARTKLLKYLRNTQPGRYSAVVARLGLRK